MKRISAFIAFIFVFMTACKEAEMAPLVSNDTKPGVVSNIEVENLPGGAKISYALPNDPDVLYVAAEFSTKGEKKRVVKSSVFKNHVILDGFIRTDEQEVTLYVVNRSENRSEPATAFIKPLRAPITDVYESLDIEGDFGGVNVKFFNKAEQAYVFYTLVKDEDGGWREHDRLYTEGRGERVHGVRDLPPEPLDFAFFFTDKWQNSSDTLYQTFTPLYEEALSKDLWNHYPLDNDYFTPLYASRPVKSLWTGSTQDYFFLQAKPDLTFPLWLTIDLGQAAIFSRLRVNQVSHNNATNWLFTNGSPRTYEVWGSNNPSSDGSWDSWTKLGDFESIKPSGLPLGTLSNEDMAVARAGEDFLFPKPPMTEAYRYIRFNITSTWGNIPIIRISELTFWGQPVN
ncbi:MAG TPA: DUF5000 domain-containing lipoprotein [Sphingobacterium sp.]|jgi:hypothetical protein|nr:DUF5000 domain-containing lipoprotein [Sphingobacterium sp.]